MTLHIYRCSNRQTKTGVTPDRTGGNLPATACQGGSQTFWKTIHINLERIGTPRADEILAAITAPERILSRGLNRIDETLESKLQKHRKKNTKKP